MKQPDTASARDRAKKSIKAWKTSEMEMTERDGERADSVSVRYPAYAGTVLEAKRGGWHENNRKHEKRQADS